MIAPATHSQELHVRHSHRGLWYENVQLAWHVLGPLALEHLQHSINALVQRHESLRTQFLSLDGELVQAILPELEVPVRQVERSGQVRSSRSRALHRLLMVDNSRPFDLRRAPLIRATLVRNGVTDHVLAITISHVVFDGWSAAVLAEELETSYRAFAHGEAPRLQVLPIQLGDYASFERQADRRQDYEYWRSELHGAPARLPVPCRPRVQPPLPRAFGYYRFTAASPATMRALERIVRAEAATVPMALLAAYATMLHAYTRSSDLVVAIGDANRDHPATHPLLGCFFRVVPVRIRLNPEVPFRTLLSSVRAAVSASYLHAIPDGELDSALPFDSTPGASVLHDTAFNFVPHRTGPSDKQPQPRGNDDVAFRRFWPPTPPLRPRASWAGTTIALTLYPDASGRLDALLRHDPDVLAPGTVAELGRMFRETIRASATSPDRPGGG
jgi:hypothetical protein